MSYKIFSPVATIYVYHESHYLLGFELQNQLGPPEKKKKIKIR